MLDKLKKNIITQDKSLKQQKLKSIKDFNENHRNYKKILKSGHEVGKEEKIKSTRTQLVKDKLIAKNLEKEVSLLSLINKTTELLYSREIEIESQRAAAYFFLGLIFSVGFFLVLWFLSFNFSILGDYLNNIFCRVKPNDT